MSDEIKIKGVDHSVTIPYAEYVRLLYCAQKLNKLEAAGVDNWERYDDAMDLLSDDDSGMAYDS